MTEATKGFKVTGTPKPDSVQAVSSDPKEVLPAAGKVVDKTKVEGMGKKKDKDNG